jgi:hypothetical protein
MALRNAHIPFRVITDRNLTDLGRNRIIVLSDLVFVSPEEEDALVEFVRQGGSLYMSGITPAKLVNRLLSLSVTGMTRETVTYMRPTGEGQRFFEMYEKKYPMTIFDKQVLAELPAKPAPEQGPLTVLAAITLPYTDPKLTTIFASIHSNPPGIDTESPALVCGSFGKGKVIWAAAPMEQSGQPVHKQVFANLIGYLNSQGQIKTDAPGQVEFTLFHNPEGSCIQVHCVNIQEQFPMIPLPGFNLALRVGKAPKRVQLLPGKEDVSFTFRDGYVEFRVEDITIFRMYQLDF